MVLMSDEQENALLDALEGVQRRETPNNLPTYLMEDSSSSVVRHLPLIELLGLYLDKVSSDARHPVRQQLSWMQQLTDLLMLDQVYDVLYATAQLGIVWKGRLHRIIRRNKATTYRTVDELVGAGLITGISKKHQEAQAILHLEKLRTPTFSKKQISSMYAVSSEYLDVITRLLQDTSVEACIGHQTRKHVEQHQEDMTRIRKQQEKMREQQRKSREARIKRTPISRVGNLEIPERVEWYRINDMKVPEDLQRKHRELQERMTDKERENQ